jgi:hypothetical protein
VRSLITPYRREKGYLLRRRSSCAATSVTRFHSSGVRQ